MKKLFLLFALLPLVACGKDDGGSDDNFAYPEVVFQNEAAGTVGWEVFNRIVPDPAAMIRRQCLDVVKVLYSSSDDPLIPDFTHIFYVLSTAVDLQIADASGVAGQPYARRIRYKSSDVETWMSYGDEKVMMQIKGVLNHELAHPYQLNPEGAGGYSPGTEHWAFIESMADAVRISLGQFPDGRVALPGGSWMIGYTTGGYFLVWLKNTKDPEFLRKLNRTAATINPWSWDAAMKSIFGDGVTTQQLWDEYQASFGN